MHVGSLPKVLAGRNTYKEHAGGMWGILNQGIYTPLWQQHDVKPIMKKRKGKPMREPVWARSLVFVVAALSRLKEKGKALALVDLAVLSWMAALGWMVAASRMVAGH